MQIYSKTGFCQIRWSAIGGLHLKEEKDYFANKETSRKKKLHMAWNGMLDRQAINLDLVLNDGYLIRFETFKSLS